MRYFLLLTALVWAFPVYAEPFIPDIKTARNAERAGDYQTAAAHWERLSSFGIPEAQYKLGQLYAEGKHVQQDQTRALSLLQQSADAGYTRAHTLIGRLYERNPGIVPTTKTENAAPLLALSLPERHDHFRAAAAEYQKALEGGDRRAARSLGKLYETGRGVAEDKERALSYYYIAADAGADTGMNITALEESLPAHSIAQAQSHAQALLPPIPARASPTPSLYVTGTIKTLAMAEDNTDLGTRSETPKGAIGMDARAGIHYKPTADIKAYTEIRSFLSSDSLSSRDDDGQDVMSAASLELRQAWVEFYRLFGMEPLSGKIGRQRFREDRGFWWNDDLDAARLSAHSTLTSGFIAMGQSLDNYRIGEDDDYAEREQERLRFLGEISHRLSMNHTIEGRFLYEYDHSGTDPIGSVVKADDWDRTDYNLAWLGLRVVGTLPFDAGDVSYRIDGAIVTGEETITRTIPGPGGGQRTITGRQDRDVFGWAADAGMETSLHTLPLSPVFSAGYAYGSGDDGQGRNNAFRQTGLHGNTSPWRHRDTDGRNQHYGEVLRPELSNIHILSLGLRLPVVTRHTLSLGYFNYWMDERRSDLGTTGITAPLSGTDSHLGQGFDISMHMPLYSDILSSRIVLGGFKAGNAYGIAEGEYAWRGTAELRFKF